MADVAELADIGEDELLDEEPSKGGGRIALILIVLVGLAGGGAAGATVLGPRVAPVLAERTLAAGADSAGSEEGGHGEEEGGHGAESGGGEPAPLHMVDNLVVNPARSAGTRFLLTSIAVETTRPELTDVLAARDVELRDALIMVLGARTVEELTDIQNRPLILDDIRQALERILGPDVVRRIYIPQFVIQ